MTRCFKSAHQRHADVQQHDVRLQARNDFDRSASVAGFADDFDAAKLLKQTCQTRARWRFVVDDKGFHHSRSRRSCGKRSVTLKSRAPCCTISAPRQPKWYSIRLLVLASAMP